MTNNKRWNKQLHQRVQTEGWVPGRSAHSWEGSPPPPPLVSRTKEGKGPGTIVARCVSRISKGCQNTTCPLSYRAPLPALLSACCFLNYGLEFLRMRSNDTLPSPQGKYLGNHLSRGDRSLEADGKTARGRWHYAAVQVAGQLH